MKRFASKAEYYRHHRKVFQLALELGVTPREAEAWMLAVEQRERHRARMARRGLTSALPPLDLKPGKAAMQPHSRPGQAAFERFDAPWMMRD